jgi:ATP synthase protein I
VGADAVGGDAAGGVGGVDEQQVNVGVTLVLSTVIGLAGGYYADRWLGTAPWLTMIGLGVGIVAGFVNLFRSTK